MKEPKMSKSTSKIGKKSSKSPKMAKVDSRSSNKSKDNKAASKWSSIYSEIESVEKSNPELIKK